MPRRDRLPEPASSVSSGCECVGVTTPAVDGEAIRVQAIRRGCAVQRAVWAEFAARRPGRRREQELYPGRTVGSVPKSQITDAHWHASRVWHYFADPINPWASAFTGTR